MGTEAGYAPCDLDYPGIRVELCFSESNCCYKKIFILKNSKHNKHSHLMLAPHLQAVSIAKNLV